VIRSFPKPVRVALGGAILDLQHGAQIGMPLSRPMPDVKPGVHELRVRDPSGAFRAFYYLKSSRGVLVFHAFEKKSQKTPAGEIRLGRKRLEEILYEKR
jgi:phage-related protein